jgi:RES domain-containing protein
MRSNVYCTEAHELRELFEPVVAVYVPQIEIMSTHELRRCEGQFIWEVLDEEWPVFEDGVEYERKKDLFEAIFAQGDHYDKDEEFQKYFSSYVERPNDCYDTDRVTTDSMTQQWEDFRREIISENRFFLRKAPDPNHLRDLLPFLYSELPRQSAFYRARLGPRVGKYPPSKMGSPPAELAGDGRANPRGIPYLYVASDPETAVSEIRPHVGAEVTVGRFKAKHPLQVVDLRDPRVQSPFGLGEDLNYVLTFLGYLRHLGLELSRPVQPDKGHVEYLPSQYLCELIKELGFDGVLYASTSDRGYNVALFHEDKVKCTRTTSYKVSAVNVEIQKASERAEPHE